MEFEFTIDLSMPLLLILIVHSLYKMVAASKVAEKKAAKGKMSKLSQEEKEQRIRMYAFIEFLIAALFLIMNLIGG
jgi:hypothetical protein